MTSAFAPAASPSFANPVRTLMQQVSGVLHTLMTAAFSRAKPRVASRFEEAEALRAMACGLQSSDPAFAQDLYAAADRHEFGEQA